MSPDHAAWFKKADEDLAMIEIGLAGGAPWPQLCLHAQQLGEKYLKGFLVRHQVLPPRIHDLQKLLDLCAIHDRSLGSLREDCIQLTEFGGRSRYPGWSDEPGEGDGRAAVEAARRIRDAIRQRVPDEGSE